MKITSLKVELVRADSAVAEFLVRIAVDGPPAACAVKGQVVGPRCRGVSTVEIVYPLIPVETHDSIFTLKGVIPEPNLWSQEMPLQYAATVEVWEENRRTDNRECLITLRGK